MKKTSENQVRIFSILLSLITSVLCVLSLNYRFSLYRVGCLWQSPIHLLCFAGELGRCRLYTRFLNPNAADLVITKENLSSRRKAASSKIRELLKSGTLIAASICLFAFLVVALGAPALDHYPETFTLAVLLTVLCVFPMVQFLGVRNAVKVLGGACDLGFINKLDVAYVDVCKNTAIGVLIGAWAGSMVYPLDWDRSWQAYPIPNIVGAIAGLAAANGYQLLQISGAKLKERIRSLGLD